MTTSLLGLPNTCGGDCSSIEINSLSDYADCLICRQEAGTNDYLEAALGTAPPDLPPNQAGNDAALACQQLILNGTAKALLSIEKELGACEVANVTAASPVDCTAAEAEAISKATDKADSAATKCTDNSGLLGCLFEPPNDPACPGASAESVATDLVDAIFDQE